MVRLTSAKWIYSRGKAVGVIRLDRVYITHRTKEHFFRKYNGFGLSASVIEELKKYDVEKVVIIYTKVDGTQEIYSCELNLFFEAGAVYKDGEDYQRILAINKFQKVV